MKVKEEGILRIVYQNVNGIATEEDLVENTTEMKNIEADIRGWVDPNVNWTANMESRANDLVENPQELQNDNYVK